MISIHIVKTTTTKKHKNRRKINSYLFKQQNPVNYEMVQLVQNTRNEKLCLKQVNCNLSFYKLLADNLYCEFLKKKGGNCIRLFFSCRRFCIYITYTYIFQMLKLLRGYS